MLADDSDTIRESSEHLSAQVAKPAVAQDDDAVVRADHDLRGNLKRRRHRLSEHCDFIGQRVGHGVQVALWHSDQIGKRAVVIQYADDRTVRAVRIQALAARLTRPAGAVDLADDAPARERPGFGDADELVAEHAAKAHIAFYELEIGFTDARTTDAHQHFPLARIGGWP